MSELSARSRRPPISVVEAIAQFKVNLTRLIPVEAAEGDTIIEFDATVGDVDGAERGGEALAEILAEREIECCVLWQIVARIRLAGKCVGESRSVINVGGSIGAPGKSHVATDVERVALVVIEWR